MGESTRTEWILQLEEVSQRKMFLQKMKISGVRKKSKPSLPEQWVLMWQQRQLWTVQTCPTPDSESVLSSSAKIPLPCFQWHSTSSLPSALHCWSLQIIHCVQMWPQEVFLAGCSRTGLLFKVQEQSWRSESSETRTARELPAAKQKCSQNTKRL